MNISNLPRILATLTTGGLVTACPKADPATEVPAARAAPTSDVAGEHACGTHTEGACGAAAPAAVATPSSRSFDVDPGGFAEVNVSMTEGSSMTITFSEGSTGLSWDVHSHDQAGETAVHERGDGGSGTIEFTAPEDGVFSGMWRNPAGSASPLRVSVVLSEGASIHSWVPAEQSS